MNLHNEGEDPGVDVGINLYADLKSMGAYWFNAQDDFSNYIHFLCGGKLFVCMPVFKVFTSKVSVCKNTTQMQVPQTEIQEAVSDYYYPDIGKSKIRINSQRSQLHLRSGER